jgi:hypothetical protein
LFAPVVLAFLAIPFYHSPAAGVIPLISTLNTDNTVSSLQFAVQTNASSDAPVVMSRSLIITLSEPLNDLYLIKTGALDYSSLTLAGQPASNNQPWNLNVHLGQIVKANNSVQLSADFSSAGKLYPGDWSLPVYASDQNDGKAKYLLAYIKVVISPASTPTATPTPTPSPTGQ